MFYWISFITLFIIFAAIIFVIWKKKIKDDDMENSTFSSLILSTCILLLLMIPLSIDIPSVLNGGEEIYVNELPTTISFGMTHKTFTDNDVLRHLNGCNWNLYEKYGSYHIRYTKLTKIVLDIEKID